MDQHIKQAEETKEEHLLTLALNAELKAKMITLENSLKVSNERVAGQDELIQIYKDSIEEQKARPQDQ